MPLHVLGINHHSAPLEVREKLAFPPETQADALNSLAGRPGVAEAVLVPTCNRTEVYCRADDLDAVRCWLRDQAANSGIDIEGHPTRIPEPRRCATPFASPPDWTLWCSASPRYSAR